MIRLSKPVARIASTRCLSSVSADELMLMMSTTHRARPRLRSVTACDIERFPQGDTHVRDRLGGAMDERGARPRRAAACTGATNLPMVAQIGAGSTQIARPRCRWGRVLYKPRRHNQLS